VSRRRLINITNTNPKYQLSIQELEMTPFSLNAKYGGSTATFSGIGTMVQIFTLLLTSAHLRSGSLAVAVPSALIYLSTLDDGTRTGSLGREEAQRFRLPVSFGVPIGLLEVPPLGTMLLFWASQKLNLAPLHPGASRFLPQRNRQGAPFRYLTFCHAHSATIRGMQTG
jgi:hypothetical protein